MLLQQANSD